MVLTSRAVWHKESLVCIPVETPCRVACAQFSPISPGGGGRWKIQLAASPSQASAAKLLKDARAKAGDLLASTEPVTQPVVKGDSTLYRARFVG